MSTPSIEDVLKRTRATSPSDHYYAVAESILGERPRNQWISWSLAACLVISLYFNWLTYGQKTVETPIQITEVENFDAQKQNIGDSINTYRSESGTNKVKVWEYKQ